MTAAETPIPPPEFSRPVVALSLAGDQTVREIEASAAECRALARRFRIEAVRSLAATVRLNRLHGPQSGMVLVRGTLTAEVVQSCVVTLEPVTERVCEEFSALFAPEERLAGSETEVTLDPFAPDEDVPEPMTAGVIDLGELTAQHLSLALDPYPRAPGAGFSGFDDDAAGAGAEAGAAPANPFGALAALKRRH
ncbi:MAG: DUF177 domain-containing protein [Rhodospirillaceae bacterium]